MKKILISLFLLPCMLCAQNVEDAYNVSQPDPFSLCDTLPAGVSATHLDSLLLEYTLAWLDTTDCKLLSDTIPLPDSVYIARLAALPCVIEMPYNEVVRRCIDLYLRHSGRIARLRTLSEYYFPLFENALHRHGLPEELKYLSIVESGLNPQAFSSAGAAGLWQFISATGKRVGLEINSLVDERLDPRKATQAACLYLKSLYALYGDWNLAIAAYNCGPGNINKAIAKAGGKRDFWDIYSFLPRETRTYLPLFIAANYVFTYAGEHGVCPASPSMPMVTDTILIDRRLHLLQVASVVGTPLEDLRRLNPQYTMDILPGGKPYTLCLPVLSVTPFLQMEDSVFRYKADSLLYNRRAVIDLAQKMAPDGYPANGMVMYKIKPGDTLSSIAKHFRCTVAQLQRWNGLKGTSIRAGRTIKIYR